MIIDLINKEVHIISTNNELKPRHKSQLRHWGFKLSIDGNLVWANDDIREVLVKVIEYFNGINLPYTLSDSCNHFFKQLKDSAEKFKRISDLAQRYKDGDFDKEDFANQVNFLNNQIHRQLKEHQIKAYYHLSLLGNAANFSVPGSGKTSVVLAHYERLRIKGDVNLLFVVGPAACFAPWRYEFEAVLERKPAYVILAGGDKIQRRSEYYKPNKHAELYLTTFQTILNDKDLLSVLFCNRLVNAYFVVDEAHYLKQIDGQWANAVLETSKYAKYRCALTGTPIPHSYSDLFNIFDLLWPDQNPISNEDRALVISLEEQGKSDKAKAILDREIGPLFYRVRKSELLLKPQIFHDPTLIEMNPIEREIYDAIVNKIRDYAREDYLRNIDVVRRLRRGRMIRLRQCLSYSKLLSTAIDEYDKEENLTSDNINLKKSILEYDQVERPAKLEILLNFVNKFINEDRKIVIWAHFIGTINLIEEALSETGYLCKKIIGEVPIEKTSLDEEETREKIISEFISPKSGLNILIANPAACAESISLHKTCHDAIYYGLSYNGAQYLQSLDRIHRVGGSENVEAHYHYLQYNATIEPDILANLNRKAQKMYDVIDGDYNIYSLDMQEYDEQSDLEAFEMIFGE